MKNDFETKFTGWTFIVAGLMLLAGWVLLPHKIEEYLVADDFASIGNNFWFWIWMFRVHIFGWVIMGAAVIGFATITNVAPFRILLVPGAGVITVGSFTMALAVAFYYSYGAWGIGQTAGKSPEEIQEFMKGVTAVNQYASCLVRFGRVFSGAGMVLMGFGMFKWQIMDRWIGVLTVLLGLAAMSIIMLIPENFEIYKPLFYIKVLWLLIMGIFLIKKGINLSFTAD